jgi:pimeloyl-ACP methyl ester carboxylesterase
LPEPVRASNQELLYLKADLINLNKMLPNLRCPLFMLHGTADAEVPVANVAYTQKRFTELGKQALFSSKVIPDYNHFMMWEHPEIVNPAIADFAEKNTAQNQASH